MEKRILEHVEEVEFLKEVARREAGRLVAAADLREILSDPNTFVDTLLTAIIVQIDELVDRLIGESRSYAGALGLAAISDDEAAKAKDDERDLFILLARPAMLAALIPVEAKLQQAIDDGVSGATLNAALDADTTREAYLSGFDSVTRSMAATYVQNADRAITERAVELTEAGAIFDDPEAQPVLFEWLAIMDSHTCDDQVENSCAPRHNVVMTLGEWDELGRPGAPQLICSIYAKGGSFCRCQLVESGKTGSADKLNPVDVTDAIKAAKERAALVYS
jgi:hypothetical protein